MPALRRARNSPCAHISAGGGLRGNPRRGFPLFSLLFYVCADTLGGFRCPVLRFDPISLVLAQRNGVEPPKKSAFYPGGSTGRVSAASRWTTRSSPDLGRGWCELFAFTFPDARPKLRWTRPTGGCSRRSRRRCREPRRRRRGGGRGGSRGSGGRTRRCVSRPR